MAAKASTRCPRTYKTRYNLQGLARLHYRPTKLENRGATHMKIAISAAALLLFLGTTSSVFAQPNRPQDNRQQDEHQQTDHQQNGHEQGRPAQKGARPTEQHARPAPTHTERSARPQQHTAHTQQHPTNRAQRPRPRTMNHGQRANARPAPHSYGRISAAHYRSNFGSAHRFHINRNDYQRHMFSYGGYSFRFVDPWPPAWSYSDPVYVVYLNGGYYMCDPNHPGIRIALSID